MVEGKGFVERDLKFLENLTISYLTQPLAGDKTKLTCTKDLGRADDGPEFRLRDMGRSHRVVGEGREAAVRGQHYALGAEERDSAPALGRDLLHRLNPVMLLVDDPDTDTAPRWQVGQHLQLTRAWRAELEKERADLHLLEKGEKRAVVPG